MRFHCIFRRSGGTRGSPAPKGVSASCQWVPEGLSFRGPRALIARYIFLTKVVFHQHAQPSLRHGRCPSSSPFEGPAGGLADPLRPHGAPWAGSWPAGLALLGAGPAACSGLRWPRRRLWPSGRWVGCGVTASLTRLFHNDHNHTLSDTGWCPGLHSAFVCFHFIQSAEAPSESAGRFFSG